MSIKSRLEEYCKLRHTKVGSFCRHAGISQSYFSQVKSDMGRDIQTRIRNTYPDLNVEWLRTGEGDMLNKKVEAVITPYPVESVEVVEDAAIVQPPFVPNSIARKPEVNVLEWVRKKRVEHAHAALNMSKIFGSTDFFIQMDNAAMSPALHQGEYLFLTALDEGTKIIDGKPYGIETEAWGILIRYLYDNGDSIIAKPENTLKFGKITIPKGEVVNTYHILFHGATTLSPSTTNEAMLVKQLKQQSEQNNTLLGLLDKAGDRIDTVLQQNTELIRTLIEKH